MRHRKSTKHLDRNAAARKALLNGLAEQLIVHEKIKTTTAKAKALRPVVERAITVSRKGTLAARRRLLGMFSTEEAVKKAMDEIGPRYKDRNGGYTRIRAIGFRQGDGAEMSQIELV